MWSRLCVGIVILLAGCTTGLSTDASTATDPGAPFKVEDETVLSTKPGPDTPTDPPSPEVTTPGPSDRVSPSHPLTPTGTLSPVSTAGPSSPQNPWRKPTVVVNVSNEAGGAPAMSDTFERALAFWAEHQEAADYRVNFSFRPDAQAADITLQYTETIDQCGGDHTEGPILGCAPYLDGVDRIHRPVVVYILASPDRKTVYNTVRHEFGHLLGIGHGEPPMPLMAANNLYTKAAPWNRSALTVYVDYSDKPGIATQEFEAQIGPVLSYFEDGAAGTISPHPTYRRVDSRSEANVVIELHDDNNPETGKSGSEMERISGDVAGTPYKRVVISLWDIDTKAVGWHIGYWLVYSFDRTVTTSDIPPPFEEADYHQRRSQWWR